LIVNKVGILRAKGASPFSLHFMLNIALRPETLKIMANGPRPVLKG
jgi:hypothetical protein